MISHRDELVLVSVSVYILMTSSSKWTLVIVEWRGTGVKEKGSAHQAARAMSNRWQGHSSTPSKVLMFGGA